MMYNRGVPFCVPFPGTLQVLLQRAVPTSLSAAVVSRSALFWVTWSLLIWVFDPPDSAGEKTYLLTMLPSLAILMSVLGP